jgi:ribosomal-protein-alanine N-acetyltransferase
MTTQTAVHIRWMIRRDMPEVLAIERASFACPWEAEDFIERLRQRDCIGMVSERDGRIVGYMIYSLRPKHLHIQNFAVDPTYRRQGVGRQMAAKLESKLTHERRTRIILEVGERNVGAQKFFSACGFRATQVLRDWYSHTTDDAYRMELAISTLTKQGEIE